MTETADARSQRRGRYRLLSLLASCALLAAGIFVLYEKIDWRDVTTVWSGLDPSLIVLAVAIYWLVYPINSFRMHRIVIWTTGRVPPAVPSLWFVFKMTCSAGFLAVAAPIGLASDAAKIAALRLFGDLSLTESARCALFDRVVGVQWLAVIGLATLPWQAAANVDRMLILGQVAVFVALLAGVGLILVLPRLLRLVRHHLIDRLAYVFAGYRAVLLPRRSLLQLAIALLNLLCGWGTLYLLFLAAGLNVNAWLVGGFVPLLQLVNSLPFLYMGWGGRELVMTGTLGAASGLTVSETLAVSIAWGVVLLLTSAVNGVFLIGTWRNTGASSESVDRASQHR